MHFAVHAANPGQVGQKLPAGGPEKAQDVLGGQRFRLLAGVGLYPPAQVFAPPWCQPVAAGCIPEESKRSEQGISLAIEYRWLVPRSEEHTSELQSRQYLVC